MADKEFLERMLSMLPEEFQPQNKNKWLMAKQL